MQLHTDWKKILKKAWSIRWMVLAALFSAAELVVPMYVDRIPLHLFATLSGIAAAGGVIARVMVQHGLD